MWEFRRFFGKWKVDAIFCQKTVDNDVSCKHWNFDSADVTIEKLNQFKSWAPVGNSQLSLFQDMSLIVGMEQIQKLEAYVAKYPAVDQLLVSLEQKTKVKKIYLLYGK